MGGITILLYGVIAVQGLRILIEQKVDYGTGSNYICCRYKRGEHQHRISAAKGNGVRCYSRGYIVFNFLVIEQPRMDEQ